MNHTHFLICPACSSALKEGEVKSVEYLCRKKYQDHPRDIYFCQNCDLGIAYPPLSEDHVKQLYFCGGYWEGLQKEMTAPNIFPGHYVLAGSRWEFLKEYARNNPKNGWSILDIGAGRGFYGMIATEDKEIILKEYCAVEADQALRVALEKVWNKKKYSAELKVVNSVDKVNRKYDLIVLSHILEHMRDPKGFLEKVSSYLTPGGLLFLDIPNKDYLFKDDVFPHLFFFDERNVVTLMRAAGLIAKRVCSYGRDIAKAQNESCFIIFLEKVFYKIRRVVPLAILVKFFSWRFKAFSKNANGTWIRVIGERK